MHSAEKISITLPPDMLRLIREAVDAGDYSSTSEGVRDAVRTWQRQRLEDTERFAALTETGDVETANVFHGGRRLCRHLSVAQRLSVNPYPA